MNTEILVEMSDSESDERSESEKPAKRARILHTDDNHDSTVKFSMFSFISTSSMEANICCILDTGH